MSLVKNRVSISNYVCVILLLALVCVQLFMPFYTYVNKEETVEVSLGEYVWFPNEHKALTSHFQHKDVFGAANNEQKKDPSFVEFKIDEIAYPHLYMLLLAGFGIVFCLLKNHSFVPILFGLSAGIIAIVNFTSNRGIVVDPQYAARVTSNSSACTVNVILGVVLVVLALFSLFGGLIAKLFTKKPAKA